MTESIAIILSLLGQFCNCFSRYAAYKFFVGFICAYLIAAHRLTVTGVYRFLGSNDNISNYHRFLSRSPWKTIHISRKLFEIILATAFTMQTAQDQHRILLVIDSTVIKKSGRKTDGIDRYYCSMTRRPEIGHEVVRLSILLTIAGLGTIEIPFMCNLYVTEKSIQKRTLDVPYSTREAMAAAMVGIVRTWTPLPILLVADALYSKETTVNPLGDIPDAYLISRRLNGQKHGGVASKKLPPPPAHIKKRRGRPRTKGEEIRFNDIPLEQFTDCQYYHRGHLETAKAVRLDDMLLRNCKNPVTIIVILGRKEERIVIISTELTLSTRRILEFYKMRFSIEFGFRDTKQYTGYTDYQVRSLESIEKHLTLSQTAYSIGKLVFLLCQDIRRRSQELFYVRKSARTLVFPMMRFQEELRSDFLVSVLGIHEKNRPDVLGMIFKHHSFLTGNRHKIPLNVQEEENVAA